MMRLLKRDTAQTVSQENVEIVHTDRDRAFEAAGLRE